ncbi:MAG: hypothetical protein ABIR46_02605 [Candidatus Saccharimonadales bacterium]
MNKDKSEREASYIRSKGGDPEQDFVDPTLSETMTPEGRSFMKRVMGSTPLRIHIMETNSLRKHRPDSVE